MTPQEALQKRAEELHRDIHAKLMADIAAKECRHDYLTIIKHYYSREITEAEERGRVSATQWQPIETAPRENMTLILTYSSYSGKISVDYYDASDEEGPFRWKPTHWMPLPAPPALKQEETKP